MSTQLHPLLFIQIWSHRDGGGLEVEIKYEARRMWADMIDGDLIQIPLQIVLSVGIG
jgi:hypothetical protein